MTDLDARARIATRIHDLLLHEQGEDIDMGLLLGRTDYARAVLSLCRGSGSAALAALAAEFTRLSPALRPGPRAATRRFPASASG